MRTTEQYFPLVLFIMLYNWCGSEDLDELKIVRTATEGGENFSPFGHLNASRRKWSCFSVLLALIGIRASSCIEMDFCNVQILCILASPFHWTPNEISSQVGIFKARAAIWPGLKIKIATKKKLYLRSLIVGSFSSSALGTYQNVPWSGWTALISLSTVTSPIFDSLSLPAMFLRIVLNTSVLLHMWRYIKPSSLDGSFFTWPYGMETRKTRGWRASAFTGGTSFTTCTHVRWERLSVWGMNMSVPDFLPIMSSFWICNSSIW